jgi:putative addiction module component (TIGR02574 family)
MSVGLEVTASHGYSIAMSSITKAEILSLSVPERIQLAEDIWDSIAEVPEALTLTDDEKNELDRRLDAYHQDPGAGSPWEVVHERLTRKG